MITRFYVDNYKSLVNFEYKPKPFELIIGGNGSGKTTVFEALDKIKRFVVEGEKISDVFFESFLTRWQSRTEQVFELEMKVLEVGIDVKYRLVLEKSYDGIRVKSENLNVGDNTYVETSIAPPSSSGNQSNAYHLVAKTNDGSEEKGPFPLANPDYSAMTLHPGFWMNIALGDVLFMRLEPSRMNPKFEKEETLPSRGFENFAAYYSHVLQEEQGDAFELTNKLREVLEGFTRFSLPKIGGDERKLLFYMNQPVKETQFSLDELSDGQRALIALYTLIQCTLKENVTIIIDEPENYIALRELQPLIVLMEERVKETGGQILLISHNQEFINMLTDRGNCTRFFRENNGHTRVVAFNPTSDLTPAEIVARGWEADE